MRTVGGHVSEGTLRRLVDEPLALSAQEREHYACCARCQERYAEAAALAHATASLLPPAAPGVDVERALAATRRSLAMAPRMGMRKRIKEMIGITEATPAASRRGAGRLARPLGGLAGAAVLVGALAFTPVGSLAQGFLTIFEPTQFTAVGVTTADLRGLRELPNLETFGTMTGGVQPALRQVEDAAAAATASGLPVLVPGTLPASVPTQPTYTVVGSSSASFTFSAAKASASAATTGKALPPMPAGLDGSTLQVTIGPGVIATYGAPATGATPASKDDPFATLPALVIAQAKSPVVASTGAGVAEIKAYLVGLPGVSEALKRQIEAIGDPASTLAIPIPLDLAVAQHVDVNGAPGLLVGDNTGVGSGVIWQRDHVVYGVAGPLSQDQVLAVARSLH